MRSIKSSRKNLLSMPSLRCLIVLIILGSGILIYSLSVFFHNTYAFSNGYYRSRDMSTEVLQEYIHQHGILTVVDMRRFIHDNTEQQLVKKLNAMYYLIPFTPKGRPDISQLQKLVKILDNSSIPLLIHCKDGVDRSGMAAFIVEVLHNTSLEKAKKQLGMDHFVLARSSVGFWVYQNYTAYLHKIQKHSSRQNFLDWLVTLNSNIAQG